MTLKIKSLGISDGDMIKVIFFNTEAIPRSSLDGENS